MTEMIYGSMSVPARRKEDVGYWWGTIDRPLMVAIMLLILVGLLLSMAASTPLAIKNDLPQFHYVMRQFVFAILAISTMLFLSRLTPNSIRRLGVLGFLITVFVLLLLPIIGTNYDMGAKRWISLGFASVQPSEFLKPGFVIMVAWLVAAGKTSGGPPGRLIATIMTLFLAGVLAMQPDFGQATLLLVSFAAIMFVGGTNFLWIGGVGLTAFLAGQFAYHNSSHVARRINGFLSGEIDPYSQIGIAANAISNGGLFGVGVGEGSEKTHLPDAHTDFIIAVAAEEYGVLMCWFITALFGFIVIRSFLKLMRTRDNFTRLAGVGLVTLIGAQSMINLGVSARLLPTKGMTLPFVSYGGSSLVAIGITFGFLLALTRFRPGDDLPMQRGKT